MTNFSKNNSGFTVVEVLLIILALVVIGIAGYFVIKHIDKPKSNTSKTNTSVSSASNQNSGIYKYKGYNFPYMPSSFVLTSKPTSNPSTSYVAVYYSATGSLSAIEADITNVCKEDNYNPGDEFDSISGTGDGESYTAQATTCSTKTDTNTWQFNIYAGTTPNLYNVSIWSEPPPIRQRN